VCPAGARALAGTDYEVERLIDEIVRDRIFFEASNGGVTFSGGEPLAQPEFLIECLRECRRRGLSTAVDTCGLASRETLLAVAKLTDLVLFDLKHMDPVRHRAATGADNSVILGNLRALSAGRVEVWVRLPLIPGFNDELENVEATAAYLADLPRRHRVFVLPYHGIADGKRSKLGGSPARSDLRAPDTEALIAVSERINSYGLQVTVGGSQ
jgi:pyruvate formate lyase activating enzyme